MGGLKPIITCRSLELGDDFDDIANKIENDPKYVGLKKLCKFYPAEKRFEYLTEGIYPNRSEHPAQIPTLFLFSNPHPDSVASGLLLSEPHSKTFWQRLFESDHLRLPDGKIDLKSWDESTRKQLGKLMLEGKYMNEKGQKSDFLIFFHCLWQIPTNQVADLKRLFVSKPQREKINKDGLKELAELVEREQIKHIIVFTGEVFHLITGVKEVRRRWNLIKCGVDDFLEDNVKEKYWNTPALCHAKAIFSNDVDVYLGLYTRGKDWGKEMEKRYFTWALDMILYKILETNKRV